MQIRYWITAIVSLLMLLLSCGEILKDVEFKGLDDLSIRALDDKKAALDGTFVLYNPNPLKIDIRKAHFDVWLDGKEIGKINQSVDATLPARGESEISLHMDLDLKDILTIDPGGILDMGLKLLRQQELLIEFKGEFTTGKSGLSIPVKVEDAINLSKEIRSTDEPKK
ncbi:MAG TPA: LEA type 2 family protein [Saprospiraceae bacterium]|nr:LEA type 2 family protein [Saprospiraceae bacterium]